MADNNMNKNQGVTDRNRTTMQHEQTKTGAGGKDNQSRASGEFDPNRQGKSAIGGGDNRSETGEPGRARDEIRQGQGQTMGQSGNRPTGQSGASREKESSGSTNR